MRGFRLFVFVVLLSLPLFAGADKPIPNQDLFPIEKEKLCPADKPNCQAKSCMDICLADGEDEDSCLEECVQYASLGPARVCRR